MIDMENLFQLLERKSDVNDKREAKSLVLSTGSVDYDSVSFEYERGASVLRHVSFNVPGGQTIAFVGATGSGKSTVTRLIFRFYDVSSGAIRIDGQDIRDVTKDSLRRAVGMVPQVRLSDGVTSCAHVLAKLKSNLPATLSLLRIIQI